MRKSPPHSLPLSSKSAQRTIAEGGKPDGTKEDPGPVVRAPTGEISIDLVGKKPGRGAYLCPSPDCLTKAKKKKALERCFEQPVPAEVYDALAVELASAGEGAQHG